MNIDSNLIELISPIHTSLVSISYMYYSWIRTKVRIQSMSLITYTFDQKISRQMYSRIQNLYCKPNLNVIRKEQSMVNVLIADQKGSST